MPICAFVIFLCLFSSVCFCPILLCLFFCLILFYYYSLDTCLFLRRDRKGVNSDGRSGEDLGGIGGWEVKSVHCIQKEITYF